MTAAEITGRGLLTQQQWRTVHELALALFARGREIARERGLILVDTKYEFGFDPRGGIVLADEVHTPDSSRYWLAGSYGRRFAAGEPPETLDKDFVRRWVAARCDPYRDPIPEIPATSSSKPRASISRYSKPSRESASSCPTPPFPPSPASAPISPPFSERRRIGDPVSIGLCSTLCCTMLPTGGLSSPPATPANERPPNRAAA